MEQPVNTPENLGNRVPFLRQSLNRSLEPVLDDRVDRAEPEGIADAMRVLEAGDIA